MKNLIIAISLLLLPLSAYADTGSYACEGRKALSDSEAATLLKKTQDGYNKVSRVKAGFIQTSYLAALEMSELSTGDVWFVKPGKMKWHYLNPEEQIFIVRDDTLWLYQPLDRQVLVDTVNQVLLSDLPVSFLMGIGDVTKDFNIKTACKTPDGILFYLNGKDEKNVSDFKLLVNSDSYFPTGASIKDISGNTTTITLKDIDMKLAFADSEFRTDFPSGTDINDRRLEANS